MWNDLVENMLMMWLIDLMSKGKLPKDVVVKQPAQLLQCDEDGGMRKVGTVAHKGTPLPHVTTNHRVIYASINTLSA